MKKAVFAAAAALLLMTLCSCAKAPVKAPLPSGSAAYTSDPIGTQAPHTEEAVLPTVTAEGNTATPYTPLPTPSVYPDFGYKNYNTGKIVSTEGGSVYYMREKIMLSEAYPNATVKKYRPMEADSQGVPLYFTIIDNDLIGYFNIDSEGTVEGEIGSVDIATGKREHLITLPLNSQAAITLVTDKYIFWEESYDNSNWYKTRIHLYERGSKTDKIIYTHTQNPETGFKYQWNWSRPVLLDGKLYFDDVIGMVNHETSEAAVNLYCYDISSGKLELFAEESKNPKTYGDGFAWLKKGSSPDDIDVMYFDGHKTQKLTSILHYTYILDLYYGKDSFCLINWLKDSEAKLIDPTFTSEPGEGVSRSGLQLYRNGKVIPLLMTGFAEYVSSPQIANNILTYFIKNSSHAVFYDIALDKFVEMDNLPAGNSFVSYQTDDYIIFENAQYEGYKCVSIEYYVVDLDGGNT